MSKQIRACIPAKTHANMYKLFSKAAHHDPFSNISFLTLPWHCVENLYQGWQAFWNVISFFDFTQHHAKCIEKPTMTGWDNLCTRSTFHYTSQECQIFNQTQNLSVFALKTLSAAWTSPSGREREHDLCAWAVSQQLTQGSRPSCLVFNFFKRQVILTISHSTLKTFVPVFGFILCSLWIDDLVIPTSSKPTGFKTVRQTTIQGRDHCIVTFVCTTLWEGFPGLHRYAERGRSLKS